jgi:hypothetical protein
MFLINDIWDEAKKTVGNCNDALLLKWISDAVALTANKADLDGLRGYLDVCTAGCSCAVTGSICNSPAGCGRRCVSLPREVETVIGIQVGGQPVLFRGELFQFHLNGPGSCRTICEWAADDRGHNFCTMRDIITPAKVVAYLQTEADNGKKLIIYGYDDKGQVLRHQVNGQWCDGYLVPTVFGAAIPDVEAPNIARITNVFKDITVGNIRLATVDSSGTTGINLAVYEPDEQVPNYTRLQLNRSCNWVRIAYLKNNPVFKSRWDHIPLRSRRGLLVMLQAVKNYNDKFYADAHSCEADGARMEIEAQLKAEPPTYNPIQVLDMSNPRDKYDYDIR